MKTPHGRVTPNWKLWEAINAITRTLEEIIEVHDSNTKANQDE